MIHTVRVWLCIVLVVVGGAIIFWWVVIPLFERFAPRALVRRYQRLSMPFFLPLAGYVPGYGVVETIGRRTGLPRRTPVGGKLDGHAFWFVAGLGRQTLYVKNIQADPRVRVRTRGRWRSGTAHILDDDDGRRRMFTVSPMNGLFLWMAGVAPLSIRVDLD